MNLRRAFFLLLIFAIVCPGDAQELLTIEGKVFDRETKDPLPAYVMLEEAGTGITADADGTFRLRAKLPKNARTAKLSVWLIGYKKKDLGFQARIDFENGMKSIILWYKKQGLI